MICSAVMIILLGRIVQATMTVQDSADKLLHKLVGALFIRALNGLPLHHADVENVTLAKRPRPSTPSRNLLPAFGPQTISMQVLQLPFPRRVSSRQRLHISRDLLSA